MYAYYGIGHVDDEPLPVLMLHAGIGLFLLGAAIMALRAPRRDTIEISQDGVQQVHTWLGFVTGRQRLPAGYVEEVEIALARRGRRRLYIVTDDGFIGFGAGLGVTQLDFARRCVLKTFMDAARNDGTMETEGADAARRAAAG